MTKDAGSDDDSEGDGAAPARLDRLMGVVGGTAHRVGLAIAEHAEDIETLVHIGEVFE